MTKLAAYRPKATLRRTLVGGTILSCSLCLWHTGSASALKDEQGHYYDVENYIIKGEKRACTPSEFNAAYEAVKKTPGSAAAQFRLGRLYIVQHNYAKAIACLNNCMASDPQNPKYSIQKACVELALENDLAVKHNIEEALKKKQLDPGQFLTILQVLQAIEERELAYQVSQRALKNYPKLPLLTYECALAARSAGQTRAAESLLLDCRKDPPFRIRADIQLTELYYEMKNWQSVVQYSRTLADPTTRGDVNKFRVPNLLKKRSEALYRLARYAEALKPISEAITLSPMQADLRLFRAGIYRKLNNFSAAKADSLAADQLGSGY